MLCIKLLLNIVETKTKIMTTTFHTYRLKNQKGKGYKSLYAKLFIELNKNSIFSECFEEDSWFEGEDMIVVVTWKLETELPKGITEYK